MQTGRQPSVIIKLWKKEKNKGEREALSRSQWWEMRWCSGWGRGRQRWGNAVYTVWLSVVRVQRQPLLNQLQENNFYTVSQSGSKKETPTHHSVTWRQTHVSPLFSIHWNKPTIWPSVFDMLFFALNSIHFHRELVIVRIWQADTYFLRD